MSKTKCMTEDQCKAVEAEIKMMLHASRDCLRNRYTFAARNDENCLIGLRDPRVIRFDATDSYYGEAFGILRGLALLGYGTISGAVNVPAETQNFRWWLSQLENAVLAEEGYKGDGVCEYCMERYGKDDSCL